MRRDGEPGRTRKDKMLRIRCTEETFLDFKKFAAEHGNYEEALRYLLDQVRRIRRAPYSRF